MSVQITDSSFGSSPIYHGGRGGAGNYRRMTAAESAARNSAPLPPVTATHTQNKVFFGGRGGAGNVHPSSERAMFSFDEELERDRLIHAHHAPVYSIGRGGKGNLVSCDDIATRDFYSTHSQESSPRSSTSSTSSHGLAQLTQTFSAHSLKSGADKLWERVRRS